MGLSGHIARTTVGQRRGTRLKIPPHGPWSWKDSCLQEERLTGRKWAYQAILSKPYTTTNWETD